MASIQLQANRLSGSAPAGFMFGAQATGFATSRPYHDLRYKWHFGDPGVFRRMAPDIPWGRDRNVAYGPWASHVYAPTRADFDGRPALSYRVTCEVTDGTATASATLDVTLRNPDLSFPDRQTICVSAKGDLTGAPRGAHHVASMDAVHKLINRQNGAYRILLRRGETFAMNGPKKFRFRCDFLQVGHFGPESDPYPLWTDETGLRLLGKEQQVWGIDFQSFYDPGGDVAHLPRMPSSAIRVATVNPGEDYTVIHDCGISGFGSGFVPAKGRHNIFVSDCHIRNWYDYGILAGENGWVGLSGVSLLQNPLTKNYPGDTPDQKKYENNYANHGPLRINRTTGPVALSLVDCASFSSWSVSESHYAVQPPLRLNSSGIRDAELVVDRARTQGGKIGQPITNTYSTTSVPVRAVFDKIYHIAWGNMISPVATSFGGATFRNMIVVHPDTPWGTGEIIRIVPGKPDDGTNTRTPIEFYSCTFAKLQSGSNYDGSRIEWLRMMDRPHEAVQIDNNVLMAPAWGQDDFQPLDLTPAFTPLPQGKRYGETPLDTAYAVPASAAALYRPLPGSAAIGSGDREGLLAIDDFFGTIRPGFAAGPAPNGKPAQGALEPL